MSISIPAMAFLMGGVLLNAGAQLLLKAGTNVLGVLTLTRDTWPDTLLKMATQGYFALGIACYALSVFVWILLQSMGGSPRWIWNRLSGGSVAFSSRIVLKNRS